MDKTIDALIETVNLALAPNELSVKTCHDYAGVLLYHKGVPAEMEVALGVTVERPVPFLTLYHWDSLTGPVEAKLWILRQLLNVGPLTVWREVDE